MTYISLKGRFTINCKQIESKTFLEISVQTCFISKTTYCDVINQEMTRYLKIYFHVVKQVKLFLIPNR